MVPGKRGRPIRSGNAHEGTSASPTTNQATPTIGVTRAELDDAVSGLYQQIETQNALMMDRLNALLGVNQRPENNEPTFAEDAHDSQGKSIPQRAAGTAEGAPP